jgi:hypothetical protein
VPTVGIHIDSCSDESLERYLYDDSVYTHYNNNNSLYYPQSQHSMYTDVQRSFPLQFHDTSRRYSNPDIQRRCSLSLSNDDILSNDQLQQIHFDPRYRDYRSSSSLNRLSSNVQIPPAAQKRNRSTSLTSMRSSHSSGSGDILRSRTNSDVGINFPVVQRFDTNPCIYVEEYDDNNENTLKGLYNFDTNNQPLSEVSLKSCLGDNVDEIPYIDDVGEVVVDVVIPLNRATPPLAPSQKATTSIMTNRRNSNSSCRKTVSFDFFTEDEVTNDPPPAIVVTPVLTKSQTCHENICEPPPPPQNGTKPQPEPIFEFCKVKPKQQMIPMSEQETNILNSTKESITSCSNVSSPKRSSSSKCDSGIVGRERATPPKERTRKTSIVDFLERAEPPNTKIVRVKIDRDSSKKPKILWSSQSLGAIVDVDLDQLEAAGKVKALTQYFDGLDGDGRKVFSKSTPDLRVVAPPPPGGDKLTQAERDTVLQQLKEWSEFGTKPRPPPIEYVCDLHRNEPCSAAIQNIRPQDLGQCRYIDALYQKIDTASRPVPAKRTVFTKSGANLDQLLVNDTLRLVPDDDSLPPPDSYIVAKKKQCQLNCRNYENKAIRLKNAGYMISASQPDLYRSFGRHGSVDHSKCKSKSYIKLSKVNGSAFEEGSVKRGFPPPRRKWSDGMCGDGRIGLATTLS